MVVSGSVAAVAGAPVAGVGAAPGLALAGAGRSLYNIDLVGREEVVN